MNVGIVGAGPVGSLLSIFLARRGFQSTIFERRPDPRTGKQSAGRSINLAISTRGLLALKKIGLQEEVLAQSIPMYGRSVHLPNGTHSFQRYGKSHRDCIFSISRGFLNEVLMTAAEETGKVKIEFNQPVQKVDLQTPSLSVESSGTTREVSFDWIAGCDGSGSVVRDEISKESGSPAEVQHADYGYKEITLPATAAGGFALSENALHIWPRGTFMLIALPNFDRSFTCTLFLPLCGPISFESIQTPENLREFFGKYFSDALPLLPDLETCFFSNPTGRMSTVRCFPWHSTNKALILGDAAHAILPFFGQGMNCGFEDCSILDQLLEGSDNLALTFSRFGEVRKENADAIAEMATENFIEMRDRVGDPEFILKKSVESLLGESFSQDFATRYSLVTFSNVPYRLAFEIGKSGDDILKELCLGIQSPRQVDLDKAFTLIRSKMTPTLEQAKESFYGPWT